MGKMGLGCAALVAALGVGACGPLAAQELRCNQMFMNASEKRICASADLQALDQQMGAVARRVEGHQDGYKSDQRAFRKELKACDGDHACITQSYLARISALETFAGTLPPPSETEMKDLEDAAAKAQAKRDSQAEARTRLAEQQRAAEDQQARAMEVDDVEAASIEPSTIESTASAAQASAPAMAAEAPVEPKGKAPNDESPWGGLALMAAAGIGVIYSFWVWLTRVFKRCPSCKEWNAGVVYGTDRERFTDYEDRTFEDVHRNRHGQRTSTTTRTRQVAVPKITTINHLRCRHCSSQWSLSSTRRA